MEEIKKYEIHLDNFDGPLDLLLHLIDKNKMDIYDIPIAVTVVLRKIDKKGIAAKPLPAT